MTISIFLSTRHPVVFLLTLVLSIWTSVVAAADLVVEKVELHTRLNPSSPDYDEWGAYPLVERYNLHTALAPNTVDVVVIANGEGKTTLVLDILPVVGVTNWAKTEGITDLKLLEKSKTTLSSFYRFERSVVVRGRSTFTIRDVSLKTLVDTFSRLQLWPRQVIFRAGLLPIKGEKKLVNNINQFGLVLDPPD